MKLFKAIPKLVVAVGILVLAVACSKGSDSTTNPYYNGYYGNTCPTCYGGVGGVGGTSAQIQFQTPMQEGVAVASLYSQNGQVSIQGQMQVNQQSNYLCGMYPGVYQIQTVQPGMMDASGRISNLVFMAGQLTFQVYSAVLTQASAGSYRLSILNGMIPCGSVATY